MIVLEIILMCVVIYVAISLVTFGYMLVSFGYKTKSTHPEMKKVRPSDPLLVVSFNGPPRTSGNEQSPDLGFHEFLTRNSSDNWDPGDS